MSLALTYENFLKITDWLDRFNTWISVVILIGNIGYYYLEYKKRKIQNQEIKIILKRVTTNAEKPAAADEKILAQHILRKHLTRAELKGIISDSYDGRYTLNYLCSRRFSNRNTQDACNKGIARRLLPLFASPRAAKAP